MLVVVTTGSDNGCDNYLTPTLCALPRRRPQLAHLGEVLTLLQLLFSYAASNKRPAMSINAMGEVRTRDADPLTAAVRQLKVVHVTPFLHVVPLAVVHTY